MTAVKKYISSSFRNVSFSIHFGQFSYGALYLVNVIRLDYYNGSEMLPVYKRTVSNEHFSIETLARLLLDTDSAVALGKL